MRKELVRENEFGKFTLIIQTTQRGHSIFSTHEEEVMANFNATMDLLKVGTALFCNENEVKQG